MVFELTSVSSLVSSFKMKREILIESLIAAVSQLKVTLKASFVLPVDSTVKLLIVTLCKGDR